MALFSGTCINTLRCRRKLFARQAERCGFSQSDVHGTAGASSAATVSTGNRNATLTATDNIGSCMLGLSLKIRHGVGIVTEEHTE